MAGCLGCRVAAEVPGNYASRGGSARIEGCMAVVAGRPVPRGISFL